MSEDKIQSTKEAMHKFSKVMTLSDMEQTILGNSANAINQLQQENEELKKKLYSPDMIDTTCPKCGERYSINYSREIYDLKNILTEFEKWLEEKKKKAQNNWLSSPYYRGILVEINCISDKLQELKEGKNEKV